MRKGQRPSDSETSSEWRALPQGRPFWAAGAPEGLSHLSNMGPGPRNINNQGALTRADLICHFLFRRPTAGSVLRHPVAPYSKIIIKSITCFLLLLSELHPKPPRPHADTKQPFIVLTERGWKSLSQWANNRKLKFLLCFEINNLWCTELRPSAVVNTGALKETVNTFSLATKHLELHSKTVFQH